MCINENNIRVLNMYKIRHSGFKVPNFVYIGRGRDNVPSLLGNPYTHRLLSETTGKYQCSTRDEAIDNYKHYMKVQFLSNVEYRNKILDLVEKYMRGEIINLVCWCSPSRCYGDVIKKYIIDISNDLINKKK